MGDAGLRVSEVVALDWADVVLEQSQICVRRVVSFGQERLVTAPRWVTMTARLREALAAARPDGAQHGCVLTDEEGRAVEPQTVRRWIMKAERAAGVEVLGPHALRQA